jgi:hypothetical protein
MLIVDFGQVHELDSSIKLGLISVLPNTNAAFGETMWEIA